MRDKTHQQQVKRWARYIKENPDNWKTQLNEFIDAQFHMAQRFYKNLAQTKAGRETLEKLKLMRVNRK